MRVATKKDVRCVAPVGALLGEGPLWDPRIERLVFLDIKDAKVFLFDPKTEETVALYAPGMVSALGLRAAGGYIAAGKAGFASLKIVGRSVEIEAIAAPEADRPHNRFNDGKVDPFGGFWAGTMDDREEDATAGAWYRLAPDGRVARLADGFHVTNGPAFDAARGRVYFTDSARRTIHVADLNDGGFENQRPFLTFGAADGYPDGMDVDQTGGVWVAFWDGAAVRRFSPEGHLIESIETPALRPTSIALAGDHAYITSARMRLTADQLQALPFSGGLFEVGPIGVTAAPPRYFAG